MGNTPKIRFKGFTDEWEQRKLGKVSESYSGGTPTAGVKKYYGGQIPFIRSAEINCDFTELFLTEEGLENSSARLIYKGDILYALYGATSGQVGRARIEGAINQAILAIKPYIGYDAEYIAQWLRKSRQNIIETYLQGGQGNLSGAIVKDLLIEFPSLQEQQQIGVFFHCFDYLITLHQRKCDETKKLKKYMLHKMFPQHGKKNPEIRFAGFTGNWEQRKCGDVFSESREPGHSGDAAKKLTVKLWGKGVYAKDDKGSAATQYYIRHAGQFIYSKLDFLNSAFGVVPKELDSYESTADLPALDCHGINPYFMYYRAVQPSFYIVNGIVADGSRKAKRIHVDTFFNMPLMLPSKEEQDRIVTFFQNLDYLIILHQSKCDKLKDIKKFMFQNMFV